jgi:hypothetical protein
VSFASSAGLEPSPLHRAVVVVAVPAARPQTSPGSSRSSGASRAVVEHSGAAAEGPVIEGRHRARAPKSGSAEGRRAGVHGRLVVHRASAEISGVVAAAVEGAGPASIGASEPSEGCRAALPVALHVSLLPVQHVGQLLGLHEEGVLLLPLADVGVLESVLLISFGCN